ncbi:gamma-glutamyltranspeptidase / glutathione hydrolase [Sphingomonas guangdongensis]|uniref:Gamma-glutamyltranspeptidase / glutathione hydrolase n=1 Tax=Sphingomonas guangdongensis TaxID=1141890 RepID=A0A285QGF9_9SPHN|nr:gamma-glutamyltransferase family protein [Sphingomonas guangdongensis]SOB80911.1 gamma-glutamyltranspeptidase / glutathione hydrolase [Sphingomonas guangdongensis]
MRRRTFLAAVPASAAAPLLAQQNDPAPGPGQGGAPATPPPTPRWAAGDARFNRPDVHAGDRPVGASFATRTAAYGLNGACATAHPLATQAGIDILRRGGSAADAAIAVNACLGLLEPTSCGIGGDAYAMLWDPKARKVVGLASSGRSPRALSLEIARSRARNGFLPPLGAVTVSVPGAVDAWWMLHQRYGKLKWEALFEPAIHHAEAGAPTPDMVAWYIGRSLAAFQRPGSGIEETENALATYAPGGKLPSAGSVFRNPDLARTYRLIARGGRDAFYKGEIADVIDRYFKRIGGWLSKADLAAHQGVWSDPFSVDYKGVTVHGLGENTQGIATLQMLGILNELDLASAPFQSALSIHLQAEAKRLAYEDRARYYADSSMARVPAAWLVSKEYARERARLIRPDRISPVRPGDAPSKGDTTYFTVSDKDGMMVSWIQSNFRGMGSGLVADDLGFMFQDRGQLFVLKDGHPNSYAPGKRPFQTIIPGFATRNGAPWMSFGVMGGDMQPQGQTQIIVNRVDYGLEIQSAGDSPRWHHEGSSQQMGEDAAGLGPTGILRLETGVPSATKARLAEIGWKLAGPDGGFGRYHCIEHRMDGADRVYAAATDMRADGVALAY